MPNQFEINLNGMEDVEKQMARIERGLAQLQNVDAYVGSNLPYAYGIHEGHHRRGKLARRAGGSFYIRRAVNEVLSGADADLSEGLNKVTAPGTWVIRRMGLWVRRKARANAPRGGKKAANYRLWRSVKHELRPK